MRKILVLSISGVCVLAASALALADSKSAAEFVIKTCLPAMDDLSNVEIMAREGNWMPKAVSGNSSRFISSQSGWEVIQSQETFWVNVWIDDSIQRFFNVQRDFNVCFVSFPSRDVKRDEFLSFIPATVELAPIAGLTPELYEIKSNRANMVVLSIASLDNIVFTAGIHETLRPTQLREILLPDK